MKVRYNGHIVRLETGQVRMPDGSRHEVEVVRHPGGSAVVAVDDQQRVCLLRQYRFILEDWIWELPAGKRDHGEDPAVTARRELAEEAGLTARDWQSLGSMLSSPGIFTERIHLYLARDLQSVETTHETGEFIEIHWQPLEVARDWIYNGRIIDAKTQLGICLALKHLSADS